MKQYFQVKAPSGLRFVHAALAVLLASGCSVPVAEWPQWGGPNRDFMVDADGLADSWPEDGPTQLWKRELGDGYSTIAVDNGTLYTMYRIEEDEFTVALDATTGETIWEYKNPSPFTPQMAQFGPGPHSTPLLVGNRLFTIGTNTVMHCFDKRTGKVLWKHDLATEFGAPVPGYGYASSPLAYKDTVIVAVGRHRNTDNEDASEEGETEAEKDVVEQSLIAFKQSNGSVVWKNQDYEPSYSSPILIEFDGQEQLVYLMRKELVGVNPGSGDLLWHHPTVPEGANLSMPVWNGEDLLFFSSAYDSGSRGLRLTKKDGKIVPEKVWYSRKMRVHHGNVILIDEHIYGSSGDMGPAFFMGINLKTGKVAWRERGFKKATCVYGDGKLIIFDEDGHLALATVTPEKMTVLSKCKVAEHTAWAAPTLVGTKLYLRDRKHIMAFDLS